MPYTPPAQHSPVASRPESPTISRSHSYIRTQQAASSGFSHSHHPNLPRSASSASYLTKERRSPSMSKPSKLSTPDTTPRNETSGKLLSGSIRQYPLPVNELVIPAGAVISPPDSTQNSSDDEENQKKGRVRQLENLAELQAAIRIIEQHRESSPSRANEETRKARITLGLLVPSLDASTSVSEQSKSSPRPPLSQEARKISHSRSATESSAYLDRSRIQDGQSSPSGSDSDLEDSDYVTVKPPMLRKKSGELVRPALRPTSAKRRPSSMPGTPTYSKAVHFDSHLEHVRHFLQVDRPLAVSAGTSPVEVYENESDFPWGSDNSRSRGPSFRWEIRLSNFPRESLRRNSMPVRVEKVFLSADNKNLIGVVAVQNLSFQKTVVARFTLDYWKTTSEVVAEYNNDVRRREANDGCDRFNFTIKLEDQANLENKTLFFCVRYNVNGQELWDSNGSINFQVNFSKKPVAPKGKPGHRASSSLNSLLRSRPSPPTSSGKPRPKSTSFEDFDSGFESQYDFGSFPAPSAKVIGDTPLRFRNPKAASKEAGDGSSKNVPVQAFGNRYDFGASLSAAINAANLSERGSYQQKDDFVFPPCKQDKEAPFNLEPAPRSSKGVVGLVIGKEGQADISKAAVAENASGDIPKPATLTLEKPSLQSQSYSELLDKYCFFGSAKASPALQRPSNGQVDGVDDYISTGSHGTSNTSSSATPSSPYSPPVEELRIRPVVVAPRLARSASPVSFGYPYRQPMQKGFFSDSITPTAIRG